MTVGRSPRSCCGLIFSDGSECRIYGECVVKQMAHVVDALNGWVVGLCLLLTRWRPKEKFLLSTMSGDSMDQIIVDESGDIEEIIESHGVDVISDEYVVYRYPGLTQSVSVGKSGGILCVWDPNAFKKLNSTASDYFVMIQENWVSNVADLENRSLTQRDASSDASAIASAKVVNIDSRGG
ncbi:hypothetical protein Tco_0643906 [Tanacetum coccineum]